MKIVVCVLVIIFLLLAITIIRNKRGGNLTMIARNIAVIYVAVDNCPSSSQLTKVQKCFLTVLIDMISYVESGQVCTEDIAKFVKEEVSSSSDNESSESLVYKLATRTIIYIYLHTESTDPDILADCIADKNKYIHEAVNKQLALGIDGAICKRWLPIAESFINTPKWRDCIENIN